MNERSGIFFLFLLIVPQAGMSGIGDWKNFTNMNDVTALAISKSVVWAGTSGGIFRYTLGDTLSDKITNSEGLTENSVTALAVDQSGSVWIGEASGSIDIYTPSTNTWKYIRDIALTTKPVKTINGFFLAGDSMYIASGFGISLFSISRFEFIDTYSNFGTISQPNVQSVIWYQKQIWAATKSGIVVSKPNATNLPSPDAWTVYPNLDTVNTITDFKGTVYVGSKYGIHAFQGGGWSNVGGFSIPARILAHSDSVLFLTDGRSIYSMTGGAGIAKYGSKLSADVTCGALTSTKTLCIGLTGFGVGRQSTDQTTWTTFAPNGPASNSFVSIVVDNNNVLWAATGRSGGKGFLNYDGNRWNHYDHSTSSLITSDDCFSVAVGPNNSKWISTWGGGLILVDRTNTVVRNFNTVDPGFVGISLNLKYIVPGTSAQDLFGNVWTTIFISANLSKVVWKMNSDSSWESYGAAFGNYSSMLGIVVDKNNTKWFVNRMPEFPAEPRVVFFNERLNLPGTTNSWGELTAADGITNVAVNAIVLDKSGSLWMATETGITIIGDPLDPKKNITKVFLGAVRDLNITCMVVDALNNKWLGTKQGVFVISPDGTSLLNEYTVSSTGGKLVSDNIVSIAYDAKKGIMYFGTEKGLSSLEVPVVQAQEKFSSLAVAPNPAMLPISSPISINGLVDDCIIKILTTQGTLIKQFAAQGAGRAFWDGNDDTGKPVASGIYIIVAHDQNGTQLASAKIAVIRR